MCIWTEIMDHFPPSFPFSCPILSLLFFLLSFSPPSSSPFLPSSKEEDLKHLIRRQLLTHVVCPERPQDDVMYGGLWFVPGVVVAIVLCLEVCQTCRLHLCPLCACVYMHVCTCVVCVVWVSVVWV